MMQTSDKDLIKPLIKKHEIIQQKLDILKLGVKEKMFSPMTKHRIFKGYVK